MQENVSENRYKAPALAKGLDILELLARHDVPLTLRQISDQLTRSKGEIFRMAQVLEERGYIAKGGGDDGYSLTNRLFMLGIERPPVRGLLEIGLPIMHVLAEKIQQSCHLTVASQDRIVVVARVESPAAIGFSVRLGHRAPLALSNSGLVLFAFQPAAVASQWRKCVDQAGQVIPPKFDDKLSTIRDAGYLIGDSRTVKSVTDVCAPILQSGVAIAAIAVPFMPVEGASKATLDDVVAAVQRATSDISEAIRIGAGGALGPGMAGMER